MKKIARILFVLLASSLVALQMGTLPSLAQEDPGNGLRIEPPRKSVVVERGSSKVVSALITNLSSEPVTVKSVVNDFESDGQTGAPKIILDENTRVERSISSYIEGLDDFDLGPDEKKNVEFVVSVPDSAPAGGYYGLIRFQSVPRVNQDEEQPQLQFSLNASLGLIVLLDVPGETVQQAELVNVTARKADYTSELNYDENTLKSGSFFNKAPDQIALDVKNTGNAFVSPFGSVKVTNMLGSEVASYNINDQNPRGVVLPESNRLFVNRIFYEKQSDGQIVKKVGFGRYKVVVDITFAQGTEPQRVEYTFWVVPVWAIVVLAILVVMSIGLVYYFVNKRRQA